MGQGDSTQDQQGGLGDKALELFKFYEAAAEKTKAQAWAQTTWILSLNAAIIAFSLNFYAEHPTLRGTWLIEVVAAIVGLVLCLFLIYMLQELGKHLSNYWTASNRLAVGYPPLIPYIGKKDAKAAQKPRYPGAPFPPFCRRLQVLTGLFLCVHLAWICIARALLNT